MPDSQSDPNLQDHFAQEAILAARRILEILKTHLSPEEFEFTGYQLRRAPLQCGGEPGLYEEHRFQADLRDGSWLVLEIASNYTCPGEALTLPLRYYRQKDNEKTNYLEAQLVEWPRFAKQFCQDYEANKERRRFTRQSQ